MNGDKHAWALITDVASAFPCLAQSWLFFSVPPVCSGVKQGVPASMFRFVLAVNPLLAWIRDTYAARLGQLLANAGADGILLQCYLPPQLQDVPGHIVLHDRQRSEQSCAGV
eukprot:5061087-Pyramimonas_sp.AAC.1